MKHMLILDPPIGNISLAMSWYLTIMSIAFTPSLIVQMLSGIASILACVNYIYQIRNNRSKSRRTKGK